MNRQTRLLIVVAIAVLTAGLASFGLYFVIRRPEQPPAQVVVARRGLQTGAILTEADVQLIKWPADFQVPGTKGSIKDVVSRCLLTAVSENDPITESKLATPDHCGLTPTITSGKLAMSVKVNEVIGVAGFILPGTRVDVIVTLRRDKESISRVVVRNVQVLTAGASYDEAEARKGGKPITTNVVTLMVDPEEAQKIALASSEGQVTLALRNPQDAGVKSIEATTTEDLLRSGKPIELPPALTPHAPPAPRMTVKVASPKDGTSVSGPTDLTAAVAANSGDVTLQWKVDGVNVGSEMTRSPYTAQWDPTSAGNGVHTVTATAQDAAGKTAFSSVTVGVVRPCTVETYKHGERKVVPCP